MKVEFADSSGLLGSRVAWTETANCLDMFGLVICNVFSIVEGFCWCRGGLCKIWDLGQPVVQFSRCRWTSTLLLLELAIGSARHPYGRHNCCQVHLAPVLSAEN